MPFVKKEEMEKLFADLEFKHPDCYFRINKVGGTFTFYVSMDGELWEQVTSSIMPHNDFDITIPVVLPGELEPLIIEEGDEDDIL